MSLWDIAKSVAKNAAVDAYKRIEESGNVRMEWEEKYSQMSKEQLKREYEGFKSGRISKTAHNGARYIAFRNVCQDRGYMK